MPQEYSPIRVVVDTNVLVSGILVRLGLPNELLQLWRRGYIQMLTAPTLIAEVTRTLQKTRIRRKYDLAEEDIDDLIANLTAAEQVIPLPDEPLPLVSRDPCDNVFLAVALAGGADYLITGDKDLLELRDSPALTALKIVTVREFMEITAMPRD
jgi:putative PIN family toxin of toxin-antitoxin system